MKKYLMIGFVAAVAFTSCSKNDFVTTTQEQIDQAKYDQAFENYVGGKVASNQDWGFGLSTRAFTRGHNANGNEWAAAGWNVPPVLTDGQKERVYKYFQCHDNLTYTSPGWTDFWVQQVYKGGTDANNSFSQTAEKYTSANGGLVTGSDHMDHLEAINGTFHDHINNFNFGDCNDWGGRMLMVSSTTASFGYFNSDGSLGHTDYTGLVDWETIEEWGNANNVGATLADGWNRSFMGFDFEQVVGEDIYQGNALYSDMPGFSGYIWDGENVIEIIDGYDENKGWAPIFKEGYETLKYNGQTVRNLKNETNQYCGDRKWKDNGDFLEEATSDNNNAIIIYKDGKKCLNMPFINEMLANKYLPVATKNFREWVKVQGGADGYFSDWIVTLIQATNCDLRIIAEDLNANQSDNDWDFNDIVLDIKYGTTAETTKVILRAAGGTMKLRIAENDEWEVHKLFDVDVNTMVNTNWTGSNSAKKDPVVVPYDKAIPNAAAAKALKLEVFKNGTWQELTANTGEPACKIGVKPSFQWLNERASIKKQYPEFTKWVTQDPTIIWY
jgi:hypothetical protein